jgi:hypothetical protein
MRTNPDQQLAITLARELIRTTLSATQLPTDHTVKAMLP